MPSRPSTQATSTRTVKERAKAAAPSRIIVLDPQPVIDCGRYAPKRTVGEPVDVRAKIVADGHDVMRAVVKWKAPGGRRWHEAPMTHIDAHLKGDTWTGSFAVDALGRWQWTIEAWIDAFASWRHELERKVAAGQHDLSGELSEGLLLLRDAAARAKSASDRKLVEHAIRTIEDDDAPEEAKHDAALGPELFAAIERYPDRSVNGTLEEPLEVMVDRERARFASWYELFPRSWGGLQGTAAAIPQIAALGFDVVYLPPVHPIGVTHRKGRNNTLTAGDDDPGSPWAIGLKGVGGHEALHPDLGTWEDFDALVATIREHDMELAIDLAINASADHPWLTEHPEWFYRRPDGSLKYAENPPKKYQDIYNVNFYNEDWKALWNALLTITLGWVERGVTIFRVDNPHTKPFAFWEWLIREVHAKHPEVVFLAEAFTRREVMRTLAKLGFNQSYTYFTWMHSRWDLEQYMLELAYETKDYFRPNFFVNTPDILTAELQYGGRPAFESRLVLAATLSPTYGVYSGYEWLEHVAVREGSEEYLDSEKYEVKERTLEGAPLNNLIRLLNDARRDNPALQHLDGLTFLDTRNDGMIAFHKRYGDNAVIVVACLNHHHVEEGLVDVRGDIGLPDAFQVQDLLDGSRYYWNWGGNFVRLGPGERMAHVFRVVAS